MIRIGRVTFPGEGWTRHVALGTRNSWDSWDKSDTCMDDTGFGKNDVELLGRLSNLPSEERKFLRMMPMLVDISATFTWWKQFDTYKVGTVSNSCSTMHTLLKRPISEKDFTDMPIEVGEVALDVIIDSLNGLRERYKATDDPKLKKQIEATIFTLLPMGYMQKRTICLNYEVLKNIYRQRRGHKLQDWKDFCLWIETLPYFSEFIAPKC